MRESHVLLSGAFPKTPPLIPSLQKHEPILRKKLDTLNSALVVVQG